jgi:hypothetical protein
MDLSPFRGRCVRRLGDAWEADLAAVGPTDAGLRAAGRVRMRITVSDLRPESADSVLGSMSLPPCALSTRRLERAVVPDPLAEPERQITDFFLQRVSARCPASTEGTPCRKRWMGDIPPDPGPDTCEFCGRSLQRSTATLHLRQAVKLFRDFYPAGTDPTAMEFSIACAVSRALGRPEALPDLHWRRWE